MNHQRFAVVVAMLALAAGCRSGPSPLINPPPADLARPAPDSFKVEFNTSKGRFTIQAFRDWAPTGVDRFYFLANNHFYDGNRFFRVIPNFVVQWGLHGNPRVAAAWQTRTISDEPVKLSNQVGFVSFAMGGPNSRTTQIFINKANNDRLDQMGFAPIGRVIDGMHVVEQFYAGYGDGGRGGVDQGLLRQQGNGYLDRWFPRLDSIVSTRVVP